MSSSTLVFGEKMINEELAKPIIAVVALATTLILATMLAVTCLAIGFSEGREYQQEIGHARSIAEAR